MEQRWKPIQVLAWIVGNEPLIATVSPWLRSGVGAHSLYIQKGMILEKGECCGKMVCKETKIQGS